MYATTSMEFVSYAFGRRLRNIQIILLVALVAMIPIVVFAASGEREGLLGIFDKAGVQGNWTDASKFNWVGSVSTFLISALCVMGAIAPIMQRLVTYFYLSTRGFWDQVYEYQEDDSGGRFLGAENIWNNVFKSANRGTGLNAFIGFFMSILINVKALSDYNPKRMPSNLNENDTIIQYTLKMFFPTVAILTILSMGWNGSLWRGYANVADGLGAVGERMVDTSLRSYIEKLQSKGEAYKFTLAQPNSRSSKVGQDIAKSLYSKAVGRTGITDTDQLMAVGLSVEQQVYQKILGSAKNADGQRAALEKITLKSGTGESVSYKTEDDLSSLEWTIVDNTNSASNLGEVVLSLKDLLGNKATISEDNNRYYHVIITQKGGARVNYFAPTN